MATRLWPILIATMSPLAAGGSEFERAGLPLLTKHCLECHGPDVQRGKLRLDTLSRTLTDKDVAATWTKVFDRVARGEMPPKN